MDNKLGTDKKTLEHNLQHQCTIFFEPICTFKQNKPGACSQKFWRRGKYFPKRVVLCTWVPSGILQNSASRELLIHHTLRGWLASHLVTLARERCTLIFCDLFPICQTTQREEMHESFELQKKYRCYLRESTKHEPNNKMQTINALLSTYPTCLRLTSVASRGTQIPVSFGVIH